VLDFFSDPSNLALFGFVGACFLVAMSGALFRPGQWYEVLDKPPWTPPNWLFGPVWMVLYAMIAVSGWIVWREVGLAPGVFAVYLAQLLLNGAWSGIFFGMRRMRLALYEVALLWLSIAANIAVFYPISGLAALLLVPYLCWVTIAAALNYEVVRRNPAYA
jgi:tryptophan-rich sensory protein